VREIHLARPDVTAVTVWIVDWDLPEKPVAARRRFYRRLAELGSKHSRFWGRSTQSVLVTVDEGLAAMVFDLASRFGRANLYRAHVVASQPRRGGNVHYEKASGEGPG